MLFPLQWSSSLLVAPFQRMDIPGWRKALGERIQSYAKANNVPVSGLAEVRLED